MLYAEQLFAGKGATMNKSLWLLVFCVHVCGDAAADESATPGCQVRFPFTESELVEHVQLLASQYFADFRHPETHVLYGARLATKRHWTSPADVKNEKPHPWGYGSRIADTSLHCGHVLVALVDAHEGRPDPLLYFEQKAARQNDERELRKND